MRIFNGTPHSINIIEGGIRFSPDIRKYVTQGDFYVSLSIPSNGVLSAKVETVEMDTIDDIPVFGKKVVGCDPIPMGYDVIIVSALYVAAAKLMGFDTSKLYTVADPIYTSDGRTILGCRGIPPAI